MADPEAYDSPIHGEGVHGRLSDLNADVLGVLELRHNFLQILRVTFRLLQPHNDWRFLETLFKDIF